MKNDITQATTNVHGHRNRLPNSLQTRPTAIGLRPMGRWIEYTF